MINGELIVDNFAGGGGASTGIEEATGYCVDIAINHDPEAIKMHKANHPYTKHYCEDVWQVDPVKVCSGHPVALAWFSPDCKHFSKAKGGKPKDKFIRGLAWVACRWAGLVCPRVIMLENVEEFKTWGPLGRRKHPIKAKQGETFQKFVQQLTDLGYEVQFRELVAADYGAPTMRKRFFLIARCDGKPMSIGSYFSQFACNYYLSQAYHYVAEQLFRERRKKTGEKVRTRLIYHQIWFMDDILLLGTSARDLEKGMKLLSEFVSQNLGLTIKPEWRVETTDYIGADGKHHGHDIDMMGYRVYCDHISIRRRTFKRHRRTILRAWAKLGRGQSLPLATCRRIMSCKGKFKNSNSAAVSKRLKIARLERIVSRTISAYDKDRAEALKKERREYHEKHSTCTGEAGRIAVHDAPRWAGGCLDQKEYRPAALPF